MMYLGAILVTGANRGLGLEMIRQLSEDSKNVVFAGCRDPEKAVDLKNLASSRSNVAILKLDVSNDNDIQLAVNFVREKTGLLNVLINNAGIYEGGHSGLAQQSRAMLQHHFDVNVTSAILMAQAFRELLVKGKEAHEAKRNSVIVNVSSEMGCIVNTSTKSYPYRCSKTALNMASKCLGNELAPEGIYCFSIHPGWAQTDMGGEGASVPVATSVSGMLKVTSEVTADINSTFVDYLGQPRKY